MQHYQDASMSLDVLLSFPVSVWYLTYIEEPHMFHCIIVLIFIVASFHGAIILATRHMLPHVEQWRDRFSYSINFTVQPATNESISNESEQIHITRNQYNDRASGGSPPPYTKYVSTNLALAHFVLASCYRNTQDVVQHKRQRFVTFSLPLCTITHLLSVG